MASRPRSLKRSRAGGAPSPADAPAAARPRAELLAEARDRALRRLGMREHSRTELRAYLMRRELPEDVIDEILDAMPKE